MLCAILIPTRKRVDRFWKTFKSIHDTATSKDYQVVVRIDDDDEESNECIRSNKRIQVLSGPRGRGYGDLNKMYTQCALATDADFVWIMNDDCTVEGDWMERLANAPRTGHILQPLYIGNGPSIYTASEGGPFPVVPNRCWMDYGWEEIHDPADSALDELLRIRNGWKTCWMDAVKVQHDRDTDDKLSDHRKL